MWFGNESTGWYDEGIVKGNLTSIPIDLSKAQTASLEFYHCKQVEQGLGREDYDQTVVFISNDSIDWHILYSNHDNVLIWQKLSFNISTYCGNEFVQIRFYFDSVDEYYNDNHGWLIGDVIITGLVESKPSNIPSYPIIGIFLTITLISLVMIKKSKNKLNF